MVVFIGSIDKRSDKEPLLVRLLERELVNYNIEIHCQVKGIVPKRDFSLDFYIPAIKTAIEVDGGTFMKNAGHIGKNRVKDCDRDLLFLAHGVDRIIRVTPDNISMNLVRTLKYLLRDYAK
jgi:very-short-patch-repair endonuclease